MYSTGGWQIFWDYTWWETAPVVLTIWHGKGSKEFSSHTVILLHACCVLYCSGSSLLKAKTDSGDTPLDLATTEEMCMVLSRDSLDVSLSQGKAVKHQGQPGHQLVTG